MGPEIVEYLRRIDATLEPFGGQVSSSTAARSEVLEGSWSGDLIVIAFPRIDLARAWYNSAAYQDDRGRCGATIAAGEIVIMDGVPATHRATDVLAA